MIDNLLFSSLQNPGQQHDEEQKNHDQSCAIALVAVGKGVLIEQIDDRLNLGQSHISLVHDHEH